MQAPPVVCAPHLHTIRDDTTSLPRLQMPPVQLLHAMFPPEEQAARSDGVRCFTSW